MTSECICGIGPLKPSTAGCRLFGEAVQGWADWRTETAQGKSQPRAPGGDPTFSAPLTATFSCHGGADVWTTLARTDASANANANHIFKHDLIARLLPRFLKHSPVHDVDDPNDDDVSPSPVAPASAIPPSRPASCDCLCFAFLVERLVLFPPLSCW